jgi:hypothetical protein
MSMRNFDYSMLNLEDNIFIEDITNRVDELEESIANREDMPDGDMLKDTVAGDDEVAELKALTNLLDDLEGNGGDYQWRGNWYPSNLIRDNYFESAMDELLDDIGELPKDLPCYLSITVDYVALKQDYSSCEVDGVTYWYR